MIATSTPERPRPPYSCGQATHMYFASVRVSAQRFSAAASSGVGSRGTWTPRSSSGAFPASHSRTSARNACWAGLTGYFIGLAATGRHKWYTVAWIGLAAAAVLHGLNDWSRVNGHPVWILVVLVSRGETGPRGGSPAAACSAGWSARLTCNQRS